jgi:hypothetical protein
LTCVGVPQSLVAFADPIADKPAPTGFVLAHNREFNTKPVGAWLARDGVFSCADV